MCELAIDSEEGRGGIKPRADVIIRCAKHNRSISFQRLVHCKNVQSKLDYPTSGLVDSVCCK